MLFRSLELLPGTTYGSLEFPKLSFNKGVNLRAGINTIALLSIAVGLPVCSLSFHFGHSFLCPWLFESDILFTFDWTQNVGPHFETWNAGILGPVSLNGLNEGRRDLSWQKWSYKVGLP